MSFTENIRYEYDLNADSVVFDVGAHKGVFSLEIYKRYHCNVFAFEPVRRFFDQCIKELHPCPKVRLFPFGIGGSFMIAPFGIKGDMTGAFTASNEIEICPIVPLNEAMCAFHVERVDLLKINTEGGEYELLESILDRGLSTKIDNIQVQFHGTVPDSESRYEKIRHRLIDTHRLTFDYPWCWQNFKMR